MTPPDDDVVFPDRCLCGRPRHRHAPKFLFCTRYAHVDKQSSFHQRDEHDHVVGLDHADLSVIDGKLQVGNWDIVMVLLSLGGYVVDLVTDWLVAYYHFAHGRHLSALLIAIFAVVPTLILNAVSFGWYLESPYPNISKHAASAAGTVDEITNNNNNNCNNDKNGINNISNDLEDNNGHSDLSASTRQRTGFGGGIYWRFFACLLQLGPVLYHFDWLRYAWRMRRLQRQETQAKNNVLHRRKCAMLAAGLLQADRDATLLRLFEAFLEAAPQMLIQMHLLLDVFFIKQSVHTWNERLHGHPPNYALMLASIVFSLFSLALALVSQHRSLRLARYDKHSMSAHGCVLQLIWRLLTISVRLFCLCVFTIVFRWWLAALLGAHFLLVLLHVRCCQAIDFGSHWLLEQVVIVMGAFVNLFAPFNMAEGETRWRYAFLYVLEAVENAGILLAVLWIMPPERRPFMCMTSLLVCIAWLSGLAVMLLYYAQLHPNILAQRKAAELQKAPISVEEVPLKTKNGENSTEKMSNRPANGNEIVVQESDEMML